MSVSSHPPEPAAGARLSGPGAWLRERGGGSLTDGEVVALLHHHGFVEVKPIYGKEVRVSVDALCNVTRAGAAANGLAKAVDRMRALEAEAEKAFSEFRAAQEAMSDQGVTVDIELQPGIAAAFSSWKQTQMQEEVRREAQAEWPVRELVAAT